MLLTPLKIKNITLKNRVVMPPMCIYQADEKGFANDFHLVHYGSRAIGGVGLIIQEATAVLPNGVITKNDLGIWNDNHIKDLKRVVDVIHQNGSVAGIQISHAGRKAKIANPIGPSPLAYSTDYNVPREMSIADINEVIEAFRQAARRADKAGYDMLEIHGAHGYLIFQFLSPLSNQRTDKYKNGKLFLKEIVKAVVSQWPKEKILGLRISATEYVQKGVTPEIIAEAINFVKDLGIDIIDVSSGGNIPVKINSYPGYQLDLAKKIKELTGLLVMGGGLITDLKLANYAVETNKCDLIYFGRLLLREPYFVINNAKDIGAEIDYPKPYLRGQK